MNYDIIIPENYDIINQKASHHLMPSVPLLEHFCLLSKHVAGHPPPHHAKSAIFAKLRGQNAIFESSKLPINMGLFFRKFSAPISQTLPIFLQHNSVREREAKGGEQNQNFSLNLA